MNRNEIILEVLEAMEPRIERSLKAAKYGEPNDLRQDINEKVLLASKKMNDIDFWSFKEIIDEAPENN
ncbi:hypothetical protein [Salsuginibacillus kocurii]|uniref:hypothetical protein n=1 Tax=Salsuginibacillus kocurii TaxID=427078 RepID=UPI000368DC35|nr:hypothetical protein [Salsuginibacillus kocurii]